MTKVTKRTLLFLVILAAIWFMCCPKLSSGQAVLRSGQKWIGPVVFHWFTTYAGQTYSPWPPLKGRASWDGSVDFWNRQEKLIIEAGFNMELLQVSYGDYAQLKNHMLAIKRNRDAGQPTIKLAPFFAAESFEYYSYPKTLITEEGKDNFYQVLKKWFELYREIFPGPNANTPLDTSQLVAVNGKYLMLLWWVPLRNNFIPYDFFNYLNQRIYNDYGITGFWSGSTSWRVGNPDEVNQLFGGSVPFWRGDASEKRNANLRVGYWPPDASLPLSTFAARNRGQYYSGGWNQILSLANEIDRVYIESWNEYIEGSGMYEGLPIDHYPGDGHWTGPYFYSKCINAPCHQVEETDSWGDSPWTYIDLTRNFIIRFLNQSARPRSMIQNPFLLNGDSQGDLLAGDIIPPHVAILYPLNNAQIRGIIPVELYIYDNDRISKIYYTLDDGRQTPLGSGPNGNYLFLLFTHTLSNGPHVLKVFVEDRTGHKNYDYLNFSINN